MTRTTMFRCCILVALAALCRCGSFGDTAPEGDNRHPDTEAPSPCDEVECAFGACRSLDNRAYCDCPEDYHRVGDIHCVPNNADGDVDDEADGDPDVDLTDAATEKVTRTFSHYMDAGNSSLQPGEIRVTAGDTGYGSPFINYAVNDRWVVYCTWKYQLIACNRSHNTCWNYDIFDTESDCAFPALIENKVFTLSIKPEQSNTTRWALTQLDLETLSIDTSHSAYRDIRADGNYVVWMGEIAGIGILDAQTNSTYLIEDSGNNHCVYPDVSASRVVWQQQRIDDLCDIWTYDLLQKEARMLDMGFTSMKCTPSVSGLQAVFIDDCVNLANRTGEERLVVYNLADDTWETLLPETGPKDRPDIDRDKVVWTDLRRGGRSSGGEYVNPDVYLYDLTKKQDVPIAVLDGWQFYPRISGRWVVYADSRFDRQDDAPVKIYDLILFDLCSLELYKNEDWCRW